MFAVVLLTLSLAGCNKTKSEVEGKIDTGIVSEGTLDEESSEDLDEKVTESNDEETDETDVEDVEDDTKSDDSNKVEVNSSTQLQGTVVRSTSEVKSFTMTAKKWEFSPSTITVKQGDKVKLSITSQDVTHGFQIAEYNVKVLLEPDKTSVAEFTADKKGSFKFFCYNFCGEGHTGMNGTLVVQ